jgi:hypothetical protein
MSESLFGVGLEIVGAVLAAAFFVIDSIEDEARAALRAVPEITPRSGGIAQTRKKAIDLSLN